MAARAGTEDYPIGIDEDSFPVHRKRAHTESNPTITVDDDRTAENSERKRARTERDYCNKDTTCILCLAPCEADLWGKICLSNEACRAVFCRKCAEKDVTKLLKCPLGCEFAKCVPARRLMDRFEVLKPLCVWRCRTCFDAHLETPDMTFDDLKRHLQSDCASSPWTCDICHVTEKRSTAPSHVCKWECCTCGFVGDLEDGARHGTDSTYCVAFLLSKVERSAAEADLWKQMTNALFQLMKCMKTTTYRSLLYKVPLRVYHIDAFGHELDRVLDQLSPAISAGDVEAVRRIQPPSIRRV